MGVLWFYQLRMPMDIQVGLNICGGPTETFPLARASAVAGAACVILIMIVECTPKTVIREP